MTPEDVEEVVAAVLDLYGEGADEQERHELAHATRNLLNVIQGIGYDVVPAREEGGPWASGS